MAYALGIDVGTTFTAAATWQAGRATVLPLGRHSDAVPTVVAVRDDGQLVVGDAADRRAITDPTRVARGFKRRMGDPVSIHLGDRTFTAQALTAAVLRWVLRECSARMGGPPAQALLTHPAAWTEFRIRVLTAAAHDAGLSAPSLAVEPVAAATYYAMRSRMAAGAIVGVYDLGGGTFDASLVQRTGNGFEIYGRPEGIAELGGMDLDQEVLQYVIRTLGDGWNDVDTNDPDTLAALASFRGQVVLAKESLSDDVDTSIPVVLPGLVRHVRLTRSEFEDLARPTIDLTVDTFASMLARNHLTADQLQAVLLVGGTSRMPLIAQRLTSALHLPVTVDEHPKYAVCLGAATLAAVRLEPLSAAPASSPPHDGERQEPADESPVGRAGGAGKLLAQPPITPMSAAGRPSVSMIADMLQAGAGGPATGRLLPLPPARRPVASRPDEPLIIHASGAAHTKIIAVVFVLVLIAAAAVALLISRH